MSISIEENARAVLAETRRYDTPEEFNVAYKDQSPEMSRTVRELMEPNEAHSVTITGLRDVVAAAREYSLGLQKVGYDATRFAALCTSVRLLDTAETWFGEGKRDGSFKTRTVEEVVNASRPWRARLAAIAQHAFVFEPEIAEQFADVNSTGTLDEERRDLPLLNGLVAQHDERLRQFGLTDQLIAEGKRLEAEAQGRDLLGVLGLHNYQDAALMRNRILTHAVMLGREARAAGVNAFWNDETIRRRFEASSFRNAIRRLRPRRGRAEGPAPVDPPVDPNSPIPV